MVLTKLLGSKTARSLTVLSVLNEARRAHARGNRLRTVAFLGLAVIAYQWTIAGLAAQGVLRLFRGGSDPAPA